MAHVETLKMQSRPKLPLKPNFNVNSESSQIQCECALTADLKPHHSF